MERALFMALGRAERWLRGLADAAEVDRVEAGQDSNQTLPASPWDSYVYPFSPNIKNRIATRGPFAYTTWEIWY